MTAWERQGRKRREERVLMLRIVPAVVSTPSSKRDRCAREDVAFHDAIRGEGSGLASAPVDVVGTGASF